MVSVPVRLAPVVFAVTLKLTSPGPVHVSPAPGPNLVLLIVIHAALLTAVQLHPAGALTLMPPPPASAPTPL